MTAVEAPDIVINQEVFYKEVSKEFEE